ncbi:MAG: hypothetical protein HOO93_01270, partial [Methyloglobulus sp.]|nr:hypothetical protein [Methyloglobulus sp.]
MNNEESVYNASLLLVEHFKYCIARNGKGIHSRVFSHILHPEEDFVAVGRSKEVIDGAKAHPEHVVPCATLISESFRLINENVPRERIAELLAKHWKIAYISKDQASYLDKYVCIKNPVKSIGINCKLTEKDEVHKRTEQSGAANLVGRFP